MKFLVDEDLPRSVCELLSTYGHEVANVRDIGMRGAKDSCIASYARREKLCLLTGDFDFSDIRNYPPKKYHGIIVVNVPGHATASFILELLETFLEREKSLLRSLRGKLVIVESGRVRIR